MGLYDKSFWENVLVEAHGLVFDILVLGLIFVWMDTYRQKRESIARDLENLWDLNTLTEEVYQKKKVNILKRLNKSEVPDDMQDVSGWLARRQSQGERKVRTSVLYSLSDGAVCKDSAVIENHHLVENIEVKSSHVGFAHNPLVYWIIADRLSQHPVDWKDFDINTQPAFIQKKLLK